MEKFESISSIIKEFNIKESTLGLFNINVRNIGQFIEIPYAPHAKGFSKMPIIVDSQDRELYHSNRDTETNSMLQCDTSSLSLDYTYNSTGLTQFMKDYGIAKERYTPPSDIILESNSSLTRDILESEPERNVVKSNNDDILSSEFNQLCSNESNDSLVLKNLNSEPFHNLESEYFEDLQL